VDAVPGQLFIALGAVVAALIAGAFSYFNLVSEKESKVSEFRQNWINELRTEISTYVSRIQAVTTLGSYIHNTPVEDKYNIELLRERSRLYEEALSAYHSIHLRINKNEKRPDAKRINDSFVSAIEESQECYKAGEEDDLGYRLEQVVETAGPLLKHEWNRVRSGEPSYRWAKGIALVLVCLAIAAFGGTTYALLTTKPLPQESQPKQGAAAAAPNPAVQGPLRDKAAHRP